MTQTLVVGIDAATPSLLKRFRRGGATPRLAELFAQGASGTIDSTRPPMTPQAWTSIATGVNPGKHGIFDFRSQDPDTYAVSAVDYHDELSYPTIWDNFAAHDLSIGVVNYPMVYPPYDLEKFFISGIPAETSDRIAYPESVQSYLIDREYRVSPRRDPKDGREAYFYELQELIDERCEVTLDLAKKYNPDLLWSVFMAIDWGQHYLWGCEFNGGDAIQKLYEQIDRNIGQLIDELDPVRVVIVSDHGMTSIDQEVYLNDLLIEWDYLSLSGEAESDSHERALGAVWNIGKRWLNRNTKDRIKSILPTYLIESARSGAGTIRQNRLDENVEWPETTAFSYGSMGRVFIHDSEGYSSGVVSDAGYEDTIKELCRDFEGLSDPSGEEVVGRVLLGEQVYEGDCVDRAPDLLLEPRDWSYTVYSEVTGRPFHDTDERLGDHHPEGIVAFTGPEISTTNELDCHLMDVAPTLLYLCDLPILDSMDGSVIRAALESSRLPIEPEVVSEIDVDMGVSEFSQSKESVEDRLEDLGYL